MFKPRIKFNTQINCISPCTGDRYNNSVDDWVGRDSCLELLKNWIIQDYSKVHDKYTSNQELFSKIVPYRSGLSRFFETEIKGFKLLNEKKWVPVPKLIFYDHCEYPVTLTVTTGRKPEHNQDDYTILVGIIVTEKCGTSVGELYPDCIGVGPGTYSRDFLKNPEDVYFPANSIPDFVRSQIVNIIEILFDKGWSYDDIHGGNFLLKENKVYLIDLQSLIPLEESYPV